MANKLNEDHKVDWGIGTELAGAASLVGRYYPLNEFRKALFAVNIMSADGILDAEEVTLKIMEAKTPAGGNAQDLTDEVVVTGLINSATVVTDLTAGTGIENNDAIKLNGVTFTKKAATDASKREFADAAGLLTCIAATDLGLTAVNAAGVITITKTVAGSGTVTLEEVAGGLSGWTPEGYTTAAVAYLEVSSTELSRDDGYEYIALSVENGAANDIQVGSSLIRAVPYLSPIVQTVAGGN